MLRALSLLETAKYVSQKPKFESIEDSYKDLINYASFAVSYLRYKIPGQNLRSDIFNQPNTEADK
jgi:hypothetical protein